MNSFVGNTQRDNAGCSKKACVSKRVKQVNMQGGAELSRNTMAGSRADCTSHSRFEVFRTLVNKSQQFSEGRRREGCVCVCDCDCAARRPF